MPPIFILFSPYFKFLLRRAARLFSARPRISALVVDVDGTLFDRSVGLELMDEYYGKGEAKAINKGLQKGFMDGRLTLGESLAEGHGYLIKAGLSKKAWRRTVERMFKRNLRRGLVDALRKMQKNGLRIFVSTKGSRFVSSLVSRKLGFDGAIGSEEIFDGKGNVTGVRTVISGENIKKGKIKYITGSDALKSSFGIKPNAAAFIYDEFTDTVTMKDGGLFIFLDSGDVPWKSMAGITKRLCLYDVMLKKKDIGSLGSLLFYDVF